MAKKKVKLPPATRIEPAPEPTPAPYFEDLLDRFAEAAVAQAQELKTRQVGAHTYGADGLFVMALETLTSAQRTRDPRGYITAAAYALAAVVHAVGAWDSPGRPEGSHPVNEADYNAGFEDGRKGMKPKKVSKLEDPA